MEMKKKFQEFFKKKGVLQKDIAKEIGIRQDMVGRFIVRPNYKFLKDIIGLFPDIDLNYILKDDLENHILSEDRIVYGKKSNEELLNELEDTIKQMRENLLHK